MSKTLKTLAFLTCMSALLSACNVPFIPGI